MRSLLCTTFLVAALTAPSALGQNRKADARAAKRARGTMERLNEMSPQQRQRVLEKLPPGRRAAAIERLERYDKLPPRAKERLRNQYDEFQQLSPEKQDKVRGLFRTFNTLPEERRRDVRRELQRLRRMPAADRENRLNSDEFRNQFNSGEQTLLGDLSNLLGSEPDSPY